MVMWARIVSRNGSVRYPQTIPGKWSKGRFHAPCGQRRSSRYARTATLRSQLTRSAQFNKPYQFNTVAIPPIRSNELLVKIHAAGFCHSDLQVWQGELDTPLPLIPSHEPVGTVVQVGDEVAQTWKIGDRVGVLNFKNACSQCPSCLSTVRRLGKTDPRYCENREAGGFMTDGAFAEYMVADSASTVVLPESISFEQGAPLLCAGVCMPALN